jgi:hypothetical protein
VPDSELRWETSLSRNARSRRLPVLALPREGGAGSEFLLQTDASQGQIGCVLLQRQTEGEFKPLGFWSRKLEKAELNYSATEREALDIAWSVNLVRPYLLGHPIVVESDHLLVKRSSGRFRRISGS